jgi:hypothetical protein
LNGQAMPTAASPIPHGLAITVADDGRGAELHMQ